MSKTWWNVFLGQGRKLEDLEMWKTWEMEWSGLWSCNQERRLLLTKSGRGWQMGLKAGEGSRHVIYHFSLGRNKDVTRIQTKKQSYPCCLFTSHLRCCVIWFRGHRPTWPPPTLIFFPWFLELVSLRLAKTLFLPLLSRDGLCPLTSIMKVSSILS